MPQITSSRGIERYFASMISEVGFRVEALLAELDDFTVCTANEYQTRRSGILQEILRLVAVSMEESLTVLPTSKATRLI